MYDGNFPPNSLKILPSDSLCHYIILPPDQPEGKLVTFCREEYDFICGVGDDWMKVQDILKKAYENGREQQQENVPLHWEFLNHSQE